MWAAGKSNGSEGFVFSLRFDVATLIQTTTSVMERTSANKTGKVRIRYLRIRNRIWLSEKALFFVNEGEVPGG
ncbi:hypothetical protein C5Y97_23180 [Blastopirellula marina]|uniref:Uncharacterized protein n=1 Tax=Blastopirellula marina TaxID=124 RepID=A0A2S8F950_9BACT|nr:hypothetical protein C5Y98_23170 [Blastopirellula marina]PTL41961.1 hypothetical protein C5Y97_23180 [Blastopirellula marina]